MTDVQPAEGQGEGQGGASDLYDLSSVPEEIRGQLEPHLKTIEGNVTRKFQEAADYRKGWEPYEALGLRDIEPETLQGLISFANAAADPQWMAQWWRQYGEENGLFEGDGTGGGEDETPIEDRINAAIEQAMGPLYESLSKQEQDRLVSQAEQEISDAIGKIRGENENLTDEDGETIARLAQSYIDDPEMDLTKAINAGFEDFKRLVAAGERNLFTQKAGQPSPPEGAGAASTQPEKITDFDSASKAAIERLKAARAA